MNFPPNPPPDDRPIVESQPDTTYTLDVVARLTGLSTQTILFYHEKGLVPAAAERPAGEQLFDDEALRTIRRLEHLRTELELKEPALRLMVNLLAEIERLRSEVRSRR